jgi:hypothetical protein
MTNFETVMSIIPHLEDTRGSNVNNDRWLSFNTPRGSLSISETYRAKGYRDVKCYVAEGYMLPKRKGSYRAPSVRRDSLEELAKAVLPYVLPYTDREAAGIKATKETNDAIYKWGNHYTSMPGDSTYQMKSFVVGMLKGDQESLDNARKWLDTMESTAQTVAANEAIREVWQSYDVRVRRGEVSTLSLDKE